MYVHELNLNFCLRNRRWKSQKRNTIIISISIWMQQVCYSTLLWTQQLWTFTYFFGRSILVFGYFCRHWYVYIRTTIWTVTKEAFCMYIFNLLISCSLAPPRMSILMKWHSFNFFVLKCRERIFSSKTTLLLRLLIYIPIFLYLYICNLMRSFAWYKTHP